MTKGLSSLRLQMPANLGWLEIKLNLQKKVLFCGQISFLRTFANKKVGNQKKATPTSVLKVVFLDVLAFSISHFFINKNPQGSKSVCEKSTYYCKFGFSRLLIYLNCSFLDCFKFKFSSKLVAFVEWSEINIILK